MSDEHGMQLRTIAQPEPRVRLRRMRDVVTYEVMASDLDRLEEASGEEKNAAMFCTTAIGSALGGILGLLAWSSGDVSPIRISVYVATTLVLVIAALWFGAIWFRKAKLHKSISAEIRQNSVIPANDDYAAQASPKRSPLVPETS